MNPNSSFSSEEPKKRRSPPPMLVSESTSTTSSIAFELSSPKPGYTGKLSPNYRRETLSSFQKKKAASEKVQCVNKRSRYAYKKKEMEQIVLSAKKPKRQANVLKSLGDVERRLSFSPTPPLKAKKTEKTSYISYIYFTISIALASFTAYIVTSSAFFESKNAVQNTELKSCILDDQLPKGDDTQDSKFSEDSSFSLENINVESAAVPRVEKIILDDPVLSEQEDVRSEMSVSQASALPEVVTIEYTYQLVPLEKSPPHFVDKRILYHPTIDHIMIVDNVKVIPVEEIQVSTSEKASNTDKEYDSFPFAVPMVAMVFFLVLVKFVLGRTSGKRPFSKLVTKTRAQAPRTPPRKILHSVDNSMGLYASVETVKSVPRSVKRSRRIENMYK